MAVMLKPMASRAPRLILGCLLFAGFCLFFYQLTLSPVRTASSSARDSVLLSDVHGTYLKNNAYSSGLYAEYKTIENWLSRWKMADVEKQAKFYALKTVEFDNKADFHAWKLLFAGYTPTPNRPVIVAGVNRGDSLQEFLDLMPSVKVFGFEILKSAYDGVVERFKDKKNVQISHRGASDKEGKSSVTTDSSMPTFELAGLYERKENDRWSGLQTTTYEVRTQTFLSFYREQKLTDPMMYLLIDCEGYEPNVIKGMQLEVEENRKIFNLFQYELGGTWADSRHPDGTLGQFGLALFLENQGYEIYIMGSIGFLRVAPEFFRVSHTLDEGYGPFVQGNALVAHPTYADPILLRSLAKHTIDLK